MYFAVDVRRAEYLKQSLAGRSTRTHSTITYVIKYTHNADLMPMWLDHQDTSCNFTTRCKQSEYATNIEINVHSNILLVSNRPCNLACIRTFLGPYGPSNIALTHQGNKLAHFNGSQCSNTRETCTVYSVWSTGQSIDNTNKSKITC